MDPTLTELPASSPPPATPAAYSKTETKPLIGEALRQPAWLWLTHVVPTVLAFVSGAYAYSIIAGEMSVDEKHATLAQALVLATIAALSATLALAKQFRRTLLTNADCTGLLVMSLTVMAMGLTFTFYTIPSTLPEWIANREELLCRFACLGMLGAFYSILLLSSYPLRTHGAIEFGRALGGIVFLVVGLMVFGRIFAWIADQTHGYFFNHFPEWLGLTLLTLLYALLVAGATVVTACITRLTLIAYLGIRRQRPIYQQSLMFFIAVVGPIAGMLLNRTIPFPTDFQAPVIYLLAVINGGILMLPMVRSIFWHRVIWLAQCVMFPFSAYFFVTFLPWMPLSIFAMIGAGAGFLILVPIVLGIAHGYRIIDGCRDEIRDGVWWKPALAGLAAVLVLPAAIGWNMWQDRRTLDQALDYTFAPDYRKDTTFPGDLDRLQSSLQHLRDMKHGIFLPFLSPLYNTVVFHGLVLPDAKIDYLQKAFFGEEVSARKIGMMMSSNSRWAYDSSDAWRGQQPPTTALLKDVKVTSRKDDKGFTTSRLTVVMESSGLDQQEEFLTTIEMPEGVYVSDFGLYIGDELVPARIVEKKTAMWVFEKIASFRRDPGLLIYKSRTEIEMRVFPISSGMTRRAEIELIHPNNMRLPMQIGDKVVELNPALPTDVTALATCATPAGSVAIADGRGLVAMGIERQPYLDLLIDCSLGSEYTAETLSQSFQHARQLFPTAKLARVTAINFEAGDLVSELTPVEKLNVAEIQIKLLRMRGGLLEDRFLKRELLLAYDRMQKDQATALLRPQFVIVTSRGQKALTESGLANFLRLVPDARMVYTIAPGTDEWKNLLTNNSVFDQPAPVLLWQWAGHFAATIAGSRMAAAFPGNATGQPMVYYKSADKFVPPATAVEISGTSRFGDGVRTWAAQDEAALDPSLLQNGAAALIGLSKQTRILIPDSSFIAVESSSQWRAMEEKEKLKLANKQVFEIEEPTSAPEPATWIMLLAGVVVLALYRRRANFYFSRSATIRRSATNSL